MPTLGLRPPKQRAAIKVINLTDFTGGLNLINEPFRLEPNESPDLLNVDLGIRGGFRLRNGSSRLNSTALADDPRSVWVYESTGGVNQLMVNVGDDVLFSTGGNFTDAAISAGATTGPFRAAVFDDICYIQRNAEQVPVQWDGTTATDLTASGPTWQDDFAAPAGGHMPQAKLIANHGGYLWVANTEEDSVLHPNRVRWSHPGRPEDWREDDFIDIDIGVDGDQIVALVPYSDHLLVFKKNSMYAIFGYSFEDFQVVAVDRMRGTLHQDSVVNTPMGVFFFHWPEGVYLYTGKEGGQWIFEKIYPAIRNGDIPSTYRDEIMLGYGRSRLWVTVPLNLADVRSHTFVYDPNLGRGGGWTLFDMPTGPYVEWVTSTDTHFVGGYVGSDRIIKLEQQNLTTDDIGAGGVPYESRFTTAWVDHDQPAIRKRWKRAEAVLHYAGTELVLPVRVYRDWDPTDWVKEFEFTLPESDGAIWDTDNWDEADWNSPAGDQNIHDRGANLGSARSIALRFLPPSDAAWGVEALVLKYFPRTLRS